MTLPQPCVAAAWKSRTEPTTLTVASNSGASTERRTLTCAA